MTPFDPSAARREADHLHRLAMDAFREGQFATMERLLEPAADIAQRLDDWPLLVKERFWLAEARRMQSKYTQAITTHTWLIGLATDPDRSRQLADEATLWYLARAFQDFLECARFLPELPAERLLRVAADGLAWLDRVGKPHWAAALRTQRGDLHRRRGETEAARRDFEAALALGRRHPEAPGYTLAAHRLDLAALLSEDLGAHAEAAELLEETLNDPGTSPKGHCDALRLLAYVRQDQGDLVAAEEAARNTLDLARQMEDPSSMASAYETLGRVLQDADRLGAAAASFAQGWRWSRRVESVEYLQIALMDCARVRREQARRACGMENGETRPPDPLPAGADRRLAAWRLRSARRLLERARPLAEQLDRAEGRRTFQDNLDDVASQVDELFTRIEAVTSP
jgi:tetratricopeptide (TPR) repeat protein